MRTIQLNQRNISVGVELTDQPRSPEELINCESNWLHVYDLKLLITYYLEMLPLRWLGLEPL